MTQQHDLEAKPQKEESRASDLLQVHPPRGKESRISAVEVSNVQSRLLEIEMLLGLSSTRNKANKWRKIGSQQLVLDSDIPDDIMPFQLPKDVYSIVATCGVSSPSFWIALLVIFGLQISLLVLLLLDQIGLEDDNVLGTPANVEVIVRAAQVLALVIALFSQSDLRQGVEGISEGLPDIYQGNDSFQSMGPARWHFAYAIRFLQGFVNLFASFVLLLQAETVFDVLLNFLGVQFISDLDDLAFDLGGKGYFGYSAQQVIHDIMQARFLRDSTSHKCRTYAHVIGIFAVLVVMVGIFSNLAIQQDQGVFAIESVTAEFGDEVISFMGLFNGCYRARKEGPALNRRLVYEQIGSEVDGGKFGYCDNLEEASSEGWVFFQGNSVEDACEKYIIRSDKTNTFDLLDAAATQWYTKGGQLVDYLQVSQLPEDSMSSECGLGIFRRTNNTCDLLELPTRFDSLQGTGSRLFEKLDVTSVQVGAYLDTTQSHPIYLGKSSSEIILFTGRRWVMTTTDEGSEQFSSVRDGSKWNHTAVLDYFYNQGFPAMEQSKLKSREWVSAISEIVDTTTDPGTPLALQWYNVRYESNTGRSFPFADLTRPQEAKLGCARCDDEFVRCANEGVCVNGVCECQNRATGVLCEDAPLGDGLCDDYFNTADFEYDGGDCCGSTCTGALCGRGGLSVAFGVDLRDNTFVSQYLKDETVIGFENCIDPEMETFTIEMVPVDVPLYEIPMTAGEDCGLESVTVICDGVLYLRTPNLYMAESVDEVEKCHEDAPMIQPIHLPAGVNCELSRPLDDFEWFYDALLFRGNTTDSTSIRRGNNSATSLSWSVPAECLAEVFTEYFGDVDRLYDTNSPEGAAIQRMASDGTSALLCTLDQDLVKERYALTMLNVSLVFESRTWQEHQCYGWGSGSGGIDIICNDDDKVVSIENAGTFGIAMIGGTIPSELFLLPHLSNLDLHNNDDLFGTLPTEIGLLNSSLTRLNLNGTGIRAPLPIEFFKLSTLAYLDLGLSFEGTIPTEIGLLSELTHLNFESVDWNQIAINGTLPTEIGKLTKLSYLNLQSNSLTGTMPTEIGLLSELGYLNLEGGGWSDGLNGPLPSAEIGKLTNLSYLNLQGNAFTGSLASDIGLLTSLTSLDLRSCNLSGKIPTEIGLLDGLVELYLGNNILRGIVPTEIGLLTNLSTLDLASTDLSGTIPSEILQLPKLDQIQYSGSRLTLDVTDPDFSCDETTVELLLTTQNWPAEVTWEITKDDGTVTASGGGSSRYPFRRTPHLEKICVPSDACTFTLLNQGEESVEIIRLGVFYQFIQTWAERASMDICT
ncbi:unnamed protein product [Cylindrotheca closterium]|uniref:Disease resistance R13L4/SHOC-2-like LRR domain-containing protein n=1 Tax=Cylindrotheca closterium TaxID=2856 RepID=A0AAD2FBR6_9STRA|nr:unnamed protein product [Cylindrotheca closterium]